MTTILLREQSNVPGESDMKLRTLLLSGILSILLLQSGCQNVTEPEEGQATPSPTLVKGTVLRSDNLSPVANAFVFDLGGLARDTSKSDGSFALKLEITGRYLSKVMATKVGYGNDTVNIAVTPGVDTSIVLRLKADTLGPITSTLSGKAASIFLIGVTAENIGIRGTGSNETSQLTFEVRDSVGVPVGGSNRINVNFQILGGPGGGEFVFPTSQVSDALNGRASTRLTSGTKAGVVQVFASGTVDGRLIKSSPVRIIIAGGLPVQDRFSLSRQLANMAGGLYDNLRNRIMAIVGDKDGNPVQPGTAVYFTTTGGIIQPSAQTDINGIASVDLITGNPRPSGGIATITARTIGDSGNVVSRSLPVVFSRATRIIAPTQAFVIPDSADYSFVYKVQDDNGNPLVAGTTISVSVSGPGASDLEVIGDKQVTLPDTDDPRYTQFSVRLQDRRTGGASGAVKVTISVASQNGDLSYSFDGLLIGQDAVIGLPPSVRRPAQIALLGVTASNIYVQGVGALENSVVTYEVRDSLGSPIDTSWRSAATYSINFKPNSYVVPGGTAPRVIPSSGLTDARGRLVVSISSGTGAGVVQIFATVQVGTQTITSQPVRIIVHAGFPDQTHFSLAPQQYNFPGLDLLFVRQAITVQVVDRYSNPVRAGTAVYFNTTHGSIQTGDALTNIDGFVSKNLISSNPYPEGKDTLSVGATYTRVYAITAGENGVTVLDSALIMWTGRPVFTKTDPNNTFTLINAGSAGPFTFTITDRYGHPLSGGTSIVVAGNGVTVNGQVNTTLPDTQVGGSGITDFMVTISDPNPADPDPPQASVLTVTVNHPVYGTFTYVLATGTVD